MRDNIRRPFGTASNFLIRQTQKSPHRGRKLRISVRRNARNMRAHHFNVCVCVFVSMARSKSRAYRHRVSDAGSEFSFTFRTGPVKLCRPLPLKRIVEMETSVKQYTAGHHTNTRKSIPNQTRCYHRYQRGRRFFFPAVA